MIYLVPAWYSEADRGFAGHIVKPWYQSSYLDDEVMTYLHSLAACGQETTVLLLSYMPQLDNFLQEEGLFGTCYWSVFDYLQDTVAVARRLLSFRDLLWPETAEFIYTPFLVLVKLGQELFAKIQFTSSGHLLWIDYLEEGQIARRLYYDARGFLSSQLFYRAGKPHVQDYYNQLGQWQFRHYLEKEEFSVEINPSYQGRFRKARYFSLKSLLDEALTIYMEEIGRGHYFLIAAEARNLTLLGKWLGVQKTALLFWENRLSLADLSLGFSHLPDVRLFIGNRQSVLNQLSVWQPRVATWLLFPCNPSWQLGTSQQMEQVKIYVQVDGMTRESYVAMLTQLLTYVKDKGGSYDFFLVSKEQDVSKRQELETTLRQVLQAPDFCDEDLEDNICVTVPKTSWEQWQLLQTCRLLLDVSLEPKLQLQAQGLCAGLPQILSQASIYGEHGENIFVIEELAELPLALDYYLEHLGHWHYALSSSIVRRSFYQGMDWFNQLKTRLEK